jgi:4-hydroxybenzoate polyprenyltransferase
MSKVAAYAKLLRVPGIGAFGIAPVIAALTMGITDFYPLSLIFIIGAFASIFGFLINDYVDIELDVPIVWYILFTLFLGEKLFKPRM